MGDQEQDQLHILWGAGPNKNVWPFAQEAVRISRWQQHEARGLVKGRGHVSAGALSCEASPAREDGTSSRLPRNISDKMTLINNKNDR